MNLVRDDYEWHLRDIMAAHNLWKSTDLIPLLEARGISLSYAQVHRLVTEKPERLSLRTLSALCHIFECTPTDLVEPIEVAARRAASGAVGKESDIRAGTDAIRPTRARITDLNR